MEKTRALFALEADTERLLQRRAHRSERRLIPRRLDTRQPVTGVGREQPGQIFRFGQRGPMGEHAAQILAESGTGLAGEGARLFQPAKKFGLAVGKTEALKRRLAIIRIQTGEREFAQVGHQHQAITAAVPGDLIAHPGRQRVLARRLDLDHAALGCLVLPRPPFPHLLRRVETEVGMPRALIGKLADTEHLRFERRANRVQQVRERCVARPLPGRAARCADSPQIGEVGFRRRGEFCAWSRHRISCYRTWHFTQVHISCGPDSRIHRLRRRATGGHYMTVLCLDA